MEAGEGKDIYILTEQDQQGRTLSMHQCRQEAGGRMVARRVAQNCDLDGAECKRRNKNNENETERHRAYNQKQGR